MPFRSSESLGDALARHVEVAWPFLVLSTALLTLVAAIEATHDSQLIRTVTDALIYLVMVIGIQIFMGNSGVLAFSNTTFMMVAAYGSIWLTLPEEAKQSDMPGLPDFLIAAQVNPYVALLLGSMLAAALALVIGTVILRLSPIGASIATFAVFAAGITVYSSWDSVTMGLNSVIGLPMYVDDYVALGCAVVALAIAFLYQSSRWGLALRASREDEVAARAHGVNVYAERLIAFVLGAFVVGAGGILQSHHFGIVIVKAFGLPLAFITIAMLVVGGQTSVTGAVAGVFAVSGVNEAFRQIEKGVSFGSTTLKVPLGTTEIVLGVVMLVILILRPQGLTGGREIPWPFHRRVTKAAGDIVQKKEMSVLD